MKTVACRMDLGMTRVAGYILYDPATMEFQETTPRDVERMVRKGQINGLTFGNTEDSPLVPDFEKWKLNNLKIKSGVGNYRNWNPNDARGDTIYSVVRAVSIKGITGPDGKELACIYETINNRCARVFYTKKQLLGLAQFAWVGGIEVDPSTETIHLCTGVEVEDWSDREVFELGTKVVSKDKLQDMTMEELFASVGGVMSEGELPQSEVEAEATPAAEATMEGGEPTAAFSEGAEASEGVAAVEASNDGEAVEITQAAETSQEEHQEPPVEVTPANDAENTDHQEDIEGTQATEDAAGGSGEHQEENTNINKESDEAPAAEEPPVEFNGEQQEETADAEQQEEQVEGEPGEEAQEDSEGDTSSEGNPTGKASKNKNHKKRSR